MVAKRAEIARIVLKSMIYFGFRLKLDFSPVNKCQLFNLSINPHAISGQSGRSLVLFLARTYDIPRAFLH